MTRETFIQTLSQACTQLGCQEPAVLFRADSRWRKQSIATMTSKGLIVNPGILTALSDRELEAVIFHELAHQCLRHFEQARKLDWIITGSFALVSIIALLMPHTIVSLCLYLAVFAVLQHGASAALSRMQEYQADAFAVEFGYQHELGHVLEQFVTSGGKWWSMHPSVAHRLAAMDKVV